jgi:hypothetical protein
LRGIPCSSDSFPCYFSQGILRERPDLIGPKRALTLTKFEFCSFSLFFSLLPGNSNVETGSSMTACATNELLRRVRLAREHPIHRAVAEPLAEASQKGYFAMSGNAFG